MAKKEKAQPKVLRVTLVRSPIGYDKRQKRTIKALGLHRLNQTVEHTESPAIRGMLAKVRHLVLIEE
jgi:large subunit ribosomal protein L30